MVRLAFKKFINTDVGLVYSGNRFGIILWHCFLVISYNLIHANITEMISFYDVLLLLRRT